MNVSVSKLLKNNTQNISDSIKKQQKWQKKQINIYYIYGRPLFDYYITNNHMLYKNTFLKKEKFIF